MKKLVILSMALVFVFTLVQAQTPVMEKEKVKEAKKELKTERVALRKLEGTQVSELSKTNFFTDFGKVPNVKWRRDATFDVAEFTKDGKNMTAFYDFDSRLVGTVQNKTFADLPAEGQKNIKVKYKDYSVGTVLFYDDNEANETDMMLYNTQFDDADNYFVELSKAGKKIVVQVTTDGNIMFFKQL